MQEVYPGIFMIRERGFFASLKPAVNVYVITGTNGLVYDSGYGDASSAAVFGREYKKIQGICAERGIKNSISRIMLSHAHADHFAGLNILRKKFGFKIIMTARMAEVVRSRFSYINSYRLDKRRPAGTLSGKIFKMLKTSILFIEYFLYTMYWGIDFVADPDIIISEETTIDINGAQWEIFHSPGHSDEHITLYNRESGILFSGDNVMRTINSWMGPPKSDLADYEESLLKISSLPDIKIILPAHGSPVTEPFERIEAIIEWRRKRTADVIEIIRNASSSGISFKEILDALYPSGGLIKKELAKGWVDLTLRKLEKDGNIMRDKSRRYINKGTSNNY